jgi:hypothetical protein
MKKLLFAVKVAGPTHASADIYFRNPGSRRRALLDSRAEAVELAEREGGYVVEVRISRKPKSRIQ